MTRRGFLLVAFGFLLIVVGVNRLSNGGLTVLVATLLIAGLIFLVDRRGGYSF